MLCSKVFLFSLSYQIINVRNRRRLHFEIQRVFTRKQPRITRIEDECVTIRLPCGSVKLWENPKTVKLEHWFSLLSFVCVRASPHQPVTSATFVCRGSFKCIEAKIWVLAHWSGSLFRCEQSQVPFSVKVSISILSVVMPTVSELWPQKQNKAVMISPYADLMTAH